MFWKRTVVGLLAAALLLGIVLLHGAYVKAAVVIVALVMEYEMIHTLKAGGKIAPVEPVLYALRWRCPRCTISFRMRARSIRWQRGCWRCLSAASPASGMIWKASVTAYSPCSTRSFAVIPL